MPGLASPQPVAPPPCIATKTVSSVSRGPSGVDERLAKRQADVEEFNRVDLHDWSSAMQMVAIR